MRILLLNEEKKAKKDFKKAKKAGTQQALQTNIRR